MAKRKKKPTKHTPSRMEPLEKCGLVMPISAIDGCEASHWEDVREILTDAASTANFECDLVSNADEVGIIQSRIIHNLYTNPIVICDVSGKNPNVMFELGMRLAFDKPTVIVKDDKTSYTFDTAPIEHLTYPRDLRFAAILEFKSKLAEKLSATCRKPEGSSQPTSFLKHFGQITAGKLDEKQLASSQDIAAELTAIRKALVGLRAREQQSFAFSPSAGGRLSPAERLQLVKHLAIQRIASQGLPREALRSPHIRREIASIVERLLPASKYFNSPSDYREAFAEVWRDLVQNYHRQIPMSLSRTR